MDNDDLERLVNNWLKPISDKLDYVTQTQQKDIDRSRNDIESLKDTVKTTETTVKNHISDHDRNLGKRQFNLGQWVVIGICILTILSDRIKF